MKSFLAVLLALFIVGACFGQSGQTQKTKEQKNKTEKQNTGKKDAGKLAPIPVEEELKKPEHKTEMNTKMEATAPLNKNNPEETKQNPQR